MIICQNCGTTNNENINRVCRTCGALLPVPTKHSKVREQKTSKVKKKEKKQVKKPAKQSVETQKKKKEEFGEFGKKYIGIVVLSEISNLTPSNIRLTSISVQLGGAPGAEDENLEKNLILEGIVLGNRVAMEASLAGYLLKLSDSVLFDQPLIREKEMGFFNDNEVLRFSAQLTLA